MKSITYGSVIAAAALLSSTLNGCGDSDSGGGGASGSSSAAGTGGASGGSGGSGGTGGSSGGSAETELDCNFPLSISPQGAGMPPGDFGAIYVCDADSATDCKVNNATAVSADEACAPGSASFFFARNVNGDQSFVAVTTNGWNVTGSTAGNQVANTTFHNLPFDTAITVMGQGKGGTYEITFEIQESPSTITIQSFSHQ